MRQLATIVFVAVSVVSVQAAAAAAPPTKKVAAAPAKEGGTELTPKETATESLPTTPSTTQTTAAGVPEADPQAPIREKAEKEATRKKQEAEALSGFQVAPIVAMGFHSTKLRTGLLGLGGESENVGAGGFGAGVRGGYVLVRGMYIGGAFVYHVGESRESRDVPGTKIEGGLWYGGPELGHQIAAGPVLIRPYAGLGYASVTLKAPVNGQVLDASGGAFALWPGVTGIVPITSSVFAGLDARYLLVLGVDHNASPNGVALAVTGGAKF